MESPKTMPLPYGLHKTEKVKKKKNVTLMKNPKIFNFTNLIIICRIIYQFTKIYWVRRIMANKQLFKDALLNAVWTLPWLDFSPTDTSPTDTSPTGQFPDRYFSDLTFLRPDISPSGYLPDCTFPWLHISSFYIYYFRADISLTLNNLFLTGLFLTI